MCKPPEEKKEEKKDSGGSKNDNISILKRGTVLGSLSLGLLFAANALTMPHQQVRRDRLGCDGMCVGSMTSFKSTLNLIGAFIMGRLSDLDTLGGEKSTSMNDKYGGAGARRLCLWLGVAATAVSLSLANKARSTRELYFSIIPSAAEQNVHILKALISEYHTDEKGKATASAGERASSAGMLGMAIGLAMMIGPATGSAVFQNLQEATHVAMILLIASALLIAMLPSPPARKNAAKKSETTFLEKFDVPSARTPAALFLLFCRLLSTISFHIYQTILIASLKYRFDFDSKDYGFFFSMIGLFFAISQGYLAKVCIDRYGETPEKRVRLLMTCTLLIAFLRYFAFYSMDLVSVYVSFAIMVTAYGVSSTMFAADTTQIAAPGELGSFFGLLAAVESGAGMAGPLVGGLLSYWHPTTAPLLAVVSLNLFTTFLISSQYKPTVLDHIKKQKGD